MLGKMQLAQGRFAMLWCCWHPVICSYGVVLWLQNSGQRSFGIFAADENHISAEDAVAMGDGSDAAAAAAHIGYKWSTWGRETWQ